MKRLLLCSCAIVLATGALSAQETSKVTWSGVAGLIGAYGPQAVQAWRANEDIAIEPSTLPPDRRSEAVQAMFVDYTEVRNGYASWSDRVQWGEVVVGGGAAAIVLFAGPQATVTVPTILVGAAITSALSITREGIGARALKDTRDLLRIHQGDILTATGMTYPQFRATLMSEGAEAAREELLANAELFRDIRLRAGDDPVQQRVAVELMLDAAIATDAAILDQIDATNLNVDRLETGLMDLTQEVRAFEVVVNRRLDLAEVRITDLETSVTSLNDAVVDLDDRVGRLEAGQGVIVDFIYDQMPPDAKVRYLQSGAMDGRLLCPDGLTDCDRAELKDSLIARFQAEAEFRAIVNDVASVTGVLNDVSTIAGNLGIPLPKEVNQAIGVANIAVAALNAASPLGAIAALSGLGGVFGGDGDAAAQRHAELMNYLDLRFDAIDERLQEISENQIKLMRAVTTLSQQMEASFRRMDQTLARIEYEQTRISGAVLKIVWDPWADCYAVYSEALSPAAQGSEQTFRYIDPGTLLFHDEASIRAIVNSSAQFNILPCLATMSAQIGSVENPGRFGNFTDLRLVVASGNLDNPNPTALAAIPTVEPVPEDTGAATADEAASAVAEPTPTETSPPLEWRNWLMRFEAEVFLPAKGRFARFVDGDLAGRSADAFVLLARPTATTDDWRNALQAIKAEPLFCNNDEHTHFENRHCALLSSPTLQGFLEPNNQASQLLANAVLGDVVNEITNWVLVLSQIADNRDGVLDEWVFLSDRVESLEAGQPMEAVIPDESPGRGLVERSIRVVDLAIASYALTYGPLSSSVAARDFVTQNSPDQLVADITNNAYLGRNTVQLILEHYHLLATGRLRPPTETYRDAYDAASIDQPGRYLFLEALFSGPLSFTVNDRGEPALRISGTMGNEVVVALPPPDAFTSGRVEMPPRYTELLEARDRLVDRLYGYDLLVDLSAEDRAAVAETLLSSTIAGSSDPL